MEKAVSRHFSKNHSLKLLFGILLVGWFLSHADLSLVVSNILSVQTSRLLCSLFLYFLAHYINSLKWHLLLRQYNLLKLFRLTLVAQYYSLLLPGQMAGEVVKAYRLGKGNTDAERVAASVLVDRLTGLIGLLLVGVAGLFWTEASVPQPLVWGLGGTIVVGVAILYSVQFRWLIGLINLLLRSLENSLPATAKLTGQSRLLLNEWRKYLKRPATLLCSVALGVIFQLTAVWITQILAAGFNIFLSLSDWCWIFATVSLALFLPVTIGGIGIREGAFLVLLGWLAVPAEQALALSLSLFGLQVIGATVGGILEIKGASFLRRP